MKYSYKDLFIIGFSMFCTFMIVDIAFPEQTKAFLMFRKTYEQFMGLLLLNMYLIFKFKFELFFFSFFKFIKLIKLKFFIIDVFIISLKSLNFVFSPECFFLSFFVMFFNFLIILLFSRYIGIFGVIFIICFNMVFALVLLIPLYFFFVQNVGVIYFELPFFIFNFSYVYLNWSFFCDSITLVMLFVVLFISFIVHIYSVIYMRNDPHLLRFLSLLSLFTFCMLILVTSVNLFQLFLGWEGVGICSYLLVNFWFTRVQANKSAIKAMLMNRFGDISFLIFIGLFFYVFRTFDLISFFVIYDSYKYSYLNFYFFYVHLYSLLSFFILIAAVGKSAQLGLHTWLPDAMEGPTPVSALIHAATMVTAGVFLLIRFYFIIDLSGIKFLIFFFGCLTALFGSLIAVMQNDIKKVIAYSTCSQLGYMVVACALGKYNLALFHLFNHAFFKALLFLSAGVILHSLLDEQDMRKMGGLLRYLPFTYICLLLASYALMGLPFLSGFYSKDLILEITFYTFTFSPFFSFYCLLFAAFFTAFYSFRLIYLVFLTLPKGHFIAYLNLHEGHFFMLCGFLLLALLSLFSGYFFFDLFMGVGSLFLNFNFIITDYNTFIDYEFMFFFYKLLPFFFSFCGLFLGYIIYKNDILIYYYTSTFLKYIFNFISNKWFFDFIYNKIFVNYSLLFAYNISYKLVDKNFLELIGVNVFSFFFFKLSFFYKNMYSTYFYSYLILLFFGVVVIFLLLYYKYNFIFLFFFNFLYFFCFFFFKKTNKNNIIKKNEKNLY